MLFCNIMLFERRTLDMRRVFLLLLLLLLPLLVFSRRRTGSFLRIPWSDEIYLKVARDSAIGTRVAKIGRPPDLWNKIRFSLSSTQAFPFSIQPASGAIFVIKSLAREEESKTFLGTITVKSTSKTSSSSTTFSATAKLTIQVAKSLPSSYRLSLVKRRFTVRLKENNEVGAFLIQLRPRKPPPDGVWIEYIVQGPGNRLVTIDNKTGTVRAKVSFDREALTVREKGYNVTFIARLRGKPNLHRGQMARLRILIEDVNDNSPKFGSPIDQTFTALENTTRGSYIGRLKATDSDIGNNAVITFSALGRSAPFQVAPNGGILLLGRLDREKRVKHTFAAIALDSGVPPLTSTTTATILVKDINDSPPQFINIPKLLVTSCENTAPNSIIGQIRALDPDEPPNDNIHYRMWEQGQAAVKMAGEESRYQIHVDSITGMVQMQVLRPSLPCDRHSVNFTITAFDPNRNDFKVERVIRLVMTKTEAEARILRSAISAELTSRSSKKVKKDTGDDADSAFSPIIVLIVIFLLCPILIAAMKMVSCALLA